MMASHQFHSSQIKRLNGLVVDSKLKTRLSTCYLLIQYMQPYLQVDSLTFPSDTFNYWIGNLFELLCI